MDTKPAVYLIQTWRDNVLQVLNDFAQIETHPARLPAGVLMTVDGRPIMLDFDHPARSMRHGVMDVLRRCGYAGNLFIQTRSLPNIHPVGI